MKTVAWPTENIPLVNIITDSPVMENSMEKFVAQRPAVAMFKLDSEEEAETMAVLEVARVPTILIIKNGKIAGRKTGLMNPSELAALYAVA